MIATIVRGVLGALLLHSAALAKPPDGSPPPQGQARLQFRDHLKTSQELLLTGATDTRSIAFTLPSRWRPLPGGALRLFVRHSKDLDGDRSFLSISLNQGILRSFRLDHRNVTPTEVVVPIPPEMLRSRNELTFAIEQSARPSGPGVEVWSSLGAQSFIAIRYREEPPELNLGKLPAPLLEINAFRGNRLAVLRPERPSPRTLEATALVVANLCKRVAPERVTVHVLGSIHAARDPLLVIGTAAEQPELLALRGRSPLAFSRSRGATVLHPTSGAALAEDEGIVGLATRTPADPNPILFVTGNSAAGVVRAARSVLGAEWNAVGAFVRVPRNPRLTASRPRDWPGFLPPRSFFSLADLGLDDLELTPRSDEPLLVALNTAPDARFLDYGNRMTLKFRVNHEAYVGSARLIVQVNDVTVAEPFAREIFGRAVGSVPVTIPTRLLKPRNILRIAWKGAPESAAQNRVVAWLLSSSEFYLPRYHETDLPDLGLLQFQLYPLGLRGDLSDVVVVVPDDPSEEVLPALLELAVAFARLAPAPHLAFRVRRLAELTRAELAEFHLVILAPERRRDPLAQLLPDWRPPARKTSVDGQPIVRALASPWSPQKYVLVIGAAPGRLQRAVSIAFSEPGLSQLRGDVTYLGDTRLEAFTLGPRRRVTEYSYLIFIEAWLRAHWLALPIILITVSALLFVGVRLGLRRYRRRAEWAPLDRPG